MWKSHSAWLKQKGDENKAFGIGKTFVVVKLPDGRATRKEAIAAETKINERETNAAEKQ